MAQLKMDLNGTTSALVGQPPNTERDYYIVRGFLRSIGLDDVDPMLGYTKGAQKPSDDYQYTPKTPGVIAGLSIVMAAILISTGGRLYLRASMSQMQFGPDDWTAMVAAAFALTYTICQVMMATRGGGRHLWDQTYEDYNVFNYYGTIDIWIFYITVGMAKMSLALFIRRLANRSSAYWRYFCDFFLGTLVVFILFGTFASVFQCHPAASQWDRLYAGRLASPSTCLTARSKILLALNVMHVVQGVLLLMAPIVMLWTVRMNTAKKIRLFITWGAGAVAVFCGLMREVRADYTVDIMWDYTELLIWTSLDIAMGIVTINLPVMDAWLSGVWRQTMTKMGRSANASGYGSNYGHHTTAAKSSRSAGPALVSGTQNQFSDSSEDIINKDNVEMNILRTDEFQVRYSSRGRDSGSEESRVYNTHTASGL